MTHLLCNLWCSAFKTKVYLYNPCNNNRNLVSLPILFGLYYWATAQRSKVSTSSNTASVSKFRTQVTVSSDSIHSCSRTPLGIFFPIQLQICIWLISLGYSFTKFTKNSVMEDILKRDPFVVN